MINNCLSTDVSERKPLRYSNPFFSKYMGQFPVVRNMYDFYEAKGKNTLLSEKFLM
jgi:hypothetical protein